MFVATGASTRGSKTGPLAPDAAGILYSRTFAGLRLTSNALLAGDFAGVLSELSNGIATPEHSAFVAKLGTASAR